MFWEAYPKQTKGCPSRTPVGLRALTQCYVALLIPVFFGPYYANLQLGIGTAFAVLIAIVVCCPSAHNGGYAAELLCKSPCTGTSPFPSIAIPGARWKYSDH